MLANIEDALGGTAKSTLNVLRAATAVALADEGSARILTEQLAMTVAAAALRRRFPSVIADAFLETRLGKPWRTTYGMLDSRFDAKGVRQLPLPGSADRRSELRQPVQRALQDVGGGHLVDDLGAALAAGVGLEERAGDGGGRQALVPEDDRAGRSAPARLRAKARVACTRGPSEPSMLSGRPRTRPATACVARRAVRSAAASAVNFVRRMVTQRRGDRGATGRRGRGRSSWCRGRGP